MNSQELRALQESYNQVYELDEAEVLAQKGGVPGSVKVKPALSIPGTDIGVGPNKPVPGTFTTTTPGQREKISKGDTTIDRGLYKQPRVGAGPTANERSRYNTAKVQQGSADRMKIEQVDLYDIILSHLLDEGYADTNKAATAIMANMSEEWKQSIVEKHATFGYNADDPGDDFDQFLEKGPKTNKQKRNAIELNNKILSKPGMPVKGV